MAKFEVETGHEFNSDRLYVMVDGKFDVAIIRTDEGIVVDIFSNEGMEAVASTYALDSDVESDEEEQAA